LLWPKKTICVNPTGYLAAGIIWAHAAILASQKGVSVEAMHEAFEYNLKNMLS